MKNAIFFKKIIVLDVMVVSLSFFAGVSFAGDCIFPDSPQSSAPSWICSDLDTGLDTKGYDYVSAGATNYNTFAGGSLARDLAAANARSNLAFRIKNEVKAEIRSYLSQVNEFTQMDAVFVADRTEVNFSYVTLTDTPVISMVVSPNNVMYILVGAKNTDVYNTKDELYKKVLGDYENYYKEEKAKENYGRLEKKAKTQRDEQNDLYLDFLARKKEKIKKFDQKKVEAIEGGDNSEREVI